MPAARPCRRCKRLWVPVGSGRPANNCPACRTADAPEADAGLGNTEFFERLRREIRADQ